MTTSKDKISRLGDKAAGAFHKVEEAGEKER